MVSYRKYVILSLVFMQRLHTEDNWFCAVSVLDLEPFNVAGKTFPFMIHNAAAAAAAAALLLTGLVINILANAVAVVVTCRHLIRCYRDCCCSNTTLCQFGSSELARIALQGLTT